jgi:DUF438 domain-containing protein
MPAQPGAEVNVSELIENGSGGRKELLKHLIQKLHAGEAPEAVRRQLQRMLGQVPHGLIVEVEQELLHEGLPPDELAKLCHLHGAALEGAISPAEPTVPPGHPVHAFRQENAALLAELDGLAAACQSLEMVPDGAFAEDALLAIRTRLNALADVDKHYLRKEHLLFPFLEKHGITGPPKVMWTKHDETRALLRAAHEALGDSRASLAERRAGVAELAVPAARAVRDMIGREENILLPMSLDTLDEREWWEIARQSPEIGFCLVAPEEEWRPSSIREASAEESTGTRIRLPTGGFSATELEAILNALPLDVTFVDADDRVRFFSHGRERIFGRSRAVLGRKVQFCHPPSSVHIVDRILDGFRSGSQERAAFWIELRGRFVHIEYVALRDRQGAYLGCLEVTQDHTEKRALTGEQRLLSWNAPEGDGCACGGGHRNLAVPPRGGERANEAAPPAWAAASAATHTLDARPMLEAGEHPVGQIMGLLASLSGEEVLQLVTPFVPDPLIERAKGRGYAAHSAIQEVGLVRTFFRRAQA